MLEWLGPIRHTALPALLMLGWLPVFLLLRARHALTVFVVASAACILIVAGPLLLGGIVVTVLLSHTVIDRLAEHRGQRHYMIVLGLVLHAAYVACFFLPVPDAFDDFVRPADRPGTFVLFSGIGLTFFRLVGYLHDCYRDPGARLTRSDFLAYMLYFPQFRHGPIERGGFIAQLRAAGNNWTPRGLAIGFGRIAVGVLIIAAAVGILVSISPQSPDADRDLYVLLSQPETLTLPQILLVMHLPAVLLYMMEAAYAHVQLGVSRTFGIVGSEQFRRPFLAPSPRDVWHRWNITLSTWLRDYAYIPLGGNRQRQHLNIVLTFVYAGLLHGPQWRCLAWGVWAGVTLALYVWLADQWQAWRAQRSTTSTAPGALHAVGAVVARLLTFHWFAIGVTIILDPETCGWRILSRYVLLLLEWVSV